MLSISDVYLYLTHQIHSAESLNVAICTDVSIASIRSAILCFRVFLRRSLGSHLIPGTLLYLCQHVNTNPVNATNVTSLDLHRPDHNATYCVPWIPNVRLRILKGRMKLDDNC